MRQQPNYTCMHCIWTWDTLWVFFVLCCFVFFSFFPLWWDNDRTTSETPSPGLEAVGLTPKILRLKLYCIWTWRFFFHLFIFYLLFIFFFSPLCLSLMPVQLTLDEYTISPCLYLWNFFLIVCLFCFFYLFVYWFYPFSLTSLLNCTQYRDNNNTKDTEGKTEKTGKLVSPQQKFSTGMRGKWRKQILRSRLQQNED
jgi:hypothetical protein